MTYWVKILRLFVPLKPRLDGLGEDETWEWPAAPVTSPSAGVAPGRQVNGCGLVLLRGCGADARTDRCLCKTLPQFGRNEEGDAACLFGLRKET